MDVNIRTCTRSYFLRPQPRDMKVVTLNRVALVTQHFNARYQKIISYTPKRWVVLDTTSLAHRVPVASRIIEMLNTSG
jgi:hypothetical protein